MSEQTTDRPRKVRTRSPSYPAINLETAIQRARELYERERQHPTPVETIVRHWGYKSLNGPASLTLAALKKFRLVDDEGTGPSRVARATDLAVDILVSPDRAARAAAIRQSALSPPIHQELWEKYRTNLPSDDNLRWELTRQRGFSESGADDFIAEYRHTIDFAQLGDVDEAPIQIAEDSGHDDAEDEEPLLPGKRRSGLRRTSAAGANVYAIPLAGAPPVLIEGAFPISEGDWAQLMAVLAAMKPGLVVSDRPAQDADD